MELLEHGPVHQYKKTLKDKSRIDSWYIISFALGMLIAALYVRNSMENNNINLKRKFQESR